jgi:adenylylsulfate kinase-like enzyme
LSDPNEPPTNPELEISTDALTLAQRLERLLDFVEEALRPDNVSRLVF